MSDVECAKCGSYNPEDEMFTVLNRGNKTYECLDEDECQKIENTPERKQKEREKYQHLDPNYQLKNKYGISMDELEELPIRYRDMSIHYKHKETGEKYSWNFGLKYWR